MTALAAYGAFCLGCTVGFCALVAQAARRDRAAAARREEVRANAALRVACVGWEDCAEWDREMTYDNQEGQ